MPDYSQYHLYYKGGDNLTINVNINNHGCDEVLSILKSILSDIHEIKQKGGITIMKLDELAVQVTENTNLETSAILLIQGIAAALAEAASDPAKVQALADQLKESAASLAAAIQANTPAV